MYIKNGNNYFREKNFEEALTSYKTALLNMPQLAKIINFNIDLVIKNKLNLEKKLIENRKPRKIPITALVITWDVGHNCLGRSYMLAEVLQQVVRHVILVGFQFDKYGSDIWEPVRDSQIPVISFPGSNFPDFAFFIEKISQRIKPDIVFACKPRLPSILLGEMIRDTWGCPLIIDIDDHELSFFKNQTPLNLESISQIDKEQINLEPYSEIWTRLSESFCENADAVIVSNNSLREKFGGVVVPHVRNESVFNPSLYNKLDLRIKYSIPINAKIILFFGTPRAHKGINTLASAINEINSNEFRLLIVGSFTDKRVLDNLEQLLPGKIIFLPNQSFSAIPEILAMADLVCLPQETQNPISKYQLPAKAIDAVAMGIPLLVANTPPLSMLVQDGVANFIDKNISDEIVYWVESERKNFWQYKTRDKFIDKYSYSAAANTLSKLIKNCLSANVKSSKFFTEIFKITKSNIYIEYKKEMSRNRSKYFVVLFWKQNDTNLYGRRHDMVIKYLSSREDIEKVIVFDSPISEFDLAKKQCTTHSFTQDKFIYVSAYKKVFGLEDTEKISFNLFVTKPGVYSFDKSDSTKKYINEGYIPYIQDVLSKNNVDLERVIFWVYPKNYLISDIIKFFNPKKVVVDVVDDHRSWPGTTDLEKVKLSKNYKEIIDLADCVFTNCEPVQQSMKEFSSCVELIPNGCDENVEINELKYSKNYYDFVLSFGKKIIGYVGNLESKIDTDLIKKISVKFPEFLIVLIGSTHANPKINSIFVDYSNVIIVGVVPYSEIAAWLNIFDVGIVPHLQMDLTNNMNPLKIFVYLTSYLPIVVSNISNIDLDAPNLFVAKSHNQFLEYVSHAIYNCPIDKDSYFRYFQKNSWKSRFEKYIDKLLSR